MRASRIAHIHRRLIQYLMLFSNRFVTALGASAVALSVLAVISSLHSAIPTPITVAMVAISVSIVAIEVVFILLPTLLSLGLMWWQGRGGRDWWEETFRGEG